LTIETKKVYPRREGSVPFEDVVEAVLRICDLLEKHCSSKQDNQRTYKNFFCLNKLTGMSQDHLEAGRV
jgi:hypothetical protein